MLSNDQVNQQQKKTGKFVLLKLLILKLKF